MNGLLIFATFTSGYAASIFTWPKVREGINGAQAEIDSLKARIEELKVKL